ncbi:MAG: riboflavin synthase [Urechidicola sp.]|jgi:riboflavin synthase|tara:strand:- start:1881 stop:2468 length:588 start_codon:yes stop_codon:yes gene_type:complete
MFTGIIETLGIVKNIVQENDNFHISIQSEITSELRIDQSVAHNGVCLTVIDIKEKVYTVTAIKETLDKTNLENLTIGDSINLERAMKLGDRLDGHIVQGHVDEIAKCISIESQNGSYRFTFKYNSKNNNITIEKGSITINGVSLTVVDSQKNTFSVAIIPYTLENTCFNNLKVDDIVNLEFDVIGKYVARLIQNN